MVQETTRGLMMTQYKIRTLCNVNKFFKHVPQASKNQEQEAAFRYVSIQIRLMGYKVTRDILMSEYTCSCPRYNVWIDGLPSNLVQMLSSQRRCTCIQVTDQTTCISYFPILGQWQCTIQVERKTKSFKTITAGDIAVLWNALLQLFHCFACNILVLTLLE